MARPSPLPVWDRHHKRLIQEFSEDHPSTYETRPDRSFHQWLESQPLFDWALAAYQNSRWSVREIEPFIRKRDIDMTPFKPVIYRSFAEFFDREFMPGARPFPARASTMGAFAEARYFAWEVLASDQKLPVKGHSLDAARLFGSEARAKAFAGGPVILARLSPVDYHHVHYPDDGVEAEHGRLGHRLWTVNQYALQSKPDILFRNECLWNLLDTDHFGKLGFIEIGALSVGRIVQVHPYGKRFACGAEKSVFRFGGSAIAVFGEQGRWRPADDILLNTRKNVETLVRLGEPIAEALSGSKSHGEQAA